MENGRILINTLDSSSNVDSDNVIGHKKSQSIRETRLCLLLTSSNFFVELKPGAIKKTFITWAKKLVIFLFRRRKSARFFSKIEFFDFFKFVLGMIRDISSTLRHSRASL